MGIQNQKGTCEIVPNALVCVFAIIKTTVVVLPVGAASGQLKWNCFNRYRLLAKSEAIVES